NCSDARLESEVRQHQSDFVDKVVEGYEGAVDTAHERAHIARGPDRAPSSGAHRVVAPGERPLGGVRVSVVEICWHDHRVLMHVDQQQIVHKTVEAPLLVTI